MKQRNSLCAFATGLVMIEHFGGNVLKADISISAESVGVGLFFKLSDF